MYKGHPNPGESDVEAALREVHEEVGVELNRSSLLDSKGELTFTDNCYTFVDYLHKDAWRRHPDYPDTNKRPMCVVYKTVRFFLAFTDSLDINLQEEEVAHAEWLSLEEALARFTFADDCSITHQLLNSSFFVEKTRDSSRN
jgi:8-oxo-dGTP pyrophosphatase MutT (NUDIX family)